jgi:hypothetical protein
MPPGGLLKLRPLDSRHRQPIRIVLLCVCWRVENGNGIPLIGDTFTFVFEFENSNFPFIM